MRCEGARAPAFELPGVSDGTQTRLGLTDALADNRAVVLFFYPFDFSPVCATELCAIQNARWFDCTPGLAVWGISPDSTYAHEAFADEYALTFPLLSDHAGAIADAFGVLQASAEDHDRVPERAVFLIDADRVIQYAWASSDLSESPDFGAVKAAIDDLQPDTAGVAPRTISDAHDDGTTDG
ncbi:redoxin domain-containing protein [Halobacterium sp. BOL4-2]|uniref:redoxin domain-containing protein n=1 Tax=Halobacterium sp. BOL4-2 TaxID=2810537 RepID=UPI001E4D43AB|nr:redoxin domain-containing protein [Halobacterium sp. BOL4-2]QRY24184.2 redoxin domain-containing protein [Halobacterium sp. BOL4-2]